MKKVRLGECCETTTRLNLMPCGAGYDLCKFHIEISLLGQPADKAFVRYCPDNAVEGELSVLLDALFLCKPRKRYHARVYYCGEYIDDLEIDYRLKAQVKHVSLAQSESTCDNLSCEDI